jgi:hypothetical protein
MRTRPAGMRSSGSPGSWPPSAAELRCVPLTLHPHPKTSNLFPEFDGMFMVANRAVLTSHAPARVRIALPRRGLRRCPPPFPPGLLQPPRGPADSVGAGNCVTSCDLAVFVDQAAEPVPAHNAYSGHFRRPMCTSGGRVLQQRPVWPVLFGCKTGIRPVLPGSPAAWMGMSGVGATGVVLAAGRGYLRRAAALS